MKDYELFEKDFDEFVRLGIEAFGLDHPGQWDREEEEAA